MAGSEWVCRFGADDLPVLGTLLAALRLGLAQTLVTGDKALLTLRDRYPIRTPAEFWAVAQQRQKQCDAKADLEQDLLPIQPAPARDSRAQLPRAPAGSCLQQHHYHRPQTLVATKTCLPIPTSGRGLIIFAVFQKNFKMIRISASFPKLAHGAAAALAAISLNPGSAQAYMVTVGGVQYDLSTYTFTTNQYTASQAFYDAIFESQPWYGNNNATYSFGQIITQSIWNELYPVSAIQAGSPVDGHFNANIYIISSVGTGNMMTGTGNGSGTLAGCENGDPITCLGPDYSNYLVSFSNGIYSGNGVVAFTPNSTYVWLSATKVLPVPGPLPALGAAAAFGFGRKLRKRVKLAPGAMGSSLPRA